MDVNSGRLMMLAGSNDDMLAQVREAAAQDRNAQWERVPEKLEPAARRVMAGGGIGQISLTSGGKLSRWAAGMRKTSRKLRKMGCR